MRLLLYNAVIVTGEKEASGALSVKGARIDNIWYVSQSGMYSYNGKELPEDGFVAAYKADFPDTVLYDIDGRLLLPGVIDAHVHFREPGMTAKADIRSESLAALFGGVTSFVDMPNTKPQTTDIEAVRAKKAVAQASSYINYGFNIGATDGNLSEIEELVEDGFGSEFGLVKVFMGSSTGNMLVADDEVLSGLFAMKDKVVMIHSEDEDIIKANLEKARHEYGEDIPFSEHPNIRSRLACIKSTVKALQKAIEYGTSLHVAHVSTAEEVEMIRAAKLHNPNITAETSANYLWFSDEDYPSSGSRIKCNPAIKSARDRDALRQALLDGIIDTIGSDHAPHLLDEKSRPYLSCPSGMPTVGQSLSVMLTVAGQIGLPHTELVKLMSENIARIMGIHGRGVLAPGSYADMVVVDPDERFVVDGNSVRYKCGWSPYEGVEVCGRVKMVFVNGILRVECDTLADLPENVKAVMPLRFDR